MTTRRPRIVVIDNYDSFTYNLVHALAMGGADVTVHRNDAVTRADIDAAHPDGIVLSPGPGHPGNERDFGVCADLIREPLAKPVPMLGICLGMQGMAHHTGGRVLAAPEVVHGEPSPCVLNPHPITVGLDGAVDVGRYHSLCVDPATLPDAWQPLGATADGTLMAMAHHDRPWIGLQFHPESILTPTGQQMIDNFLALCRRAPQ